MLHASDWRTAELLVEEALSIDANHVLAKSLRPSILLSRRLEFVDACLAETRDLQAASDLDRALAKVQGGLSTYPNDNRLLQLQATLRSAIAEQHSFRRSRDLEEMRRLSRDAGRGLKGPELSAVLEKSAVLSQRYPDDREFSAEYSAISELLSKTTSCGNGNHPYEPSVWSRDQAPVTGQAGKKQASPAELAALATRTGEWLAKIKGVLRTSVFQLVRASVGQTIRRLRDLKQFPSLRRMQWFAFGLGATLLIGLVLLWHFVISSRTSGPPPAKESTVSFASNVEGIAIQVDGRLLAGTTAKLKPGAHSLSASKLGYKTFHQQLVVDSHPKAINIDLEPEAPIIRLSADVTSGQVLLDGVEVGTLQEGNFSYSIPTNGHHRIEARRRHEVIFALDFQADPGTSVRLAGTVHSKDIPIVVVSTLGGHGFIYTSAKEAKTNLPNEEPQPTPDQGREIMLPSSATELTYNDGMSSLSLPLPKEVQNAPVLLIRAGTAAKGTLFVETNIPEATVFLNGQKEASRN